MANNFPTAVPTSFVANTKAKSAEVNANFAKVVEWLTSGNYDSYLGALFLKSAAKSADYTILDNDGFSSILVTTSSTNRTVTLPLAANNVNRIICIKKVDSGTGIVTIDGNGSETIDGATTLKLALQYESATLQCDGTTWHIVDLRLNTLWQTYTPTMTGSTSNPSGGTSSITGQWRRMDRDSMQVIIYYTQSTVRTNGSGTYLFSLPGTYTLNSGKLPSNGTGTIDDILGWATVRQASNTYQGQVIEYTSDYNKLRVQYWKSALDTPVIFNSSNNDLNANFTNGIYLNAIVPITEFV